MKKWLILLLIAAVAALPSCAQGAAAQPEPAVVFADALLEERVRTALGKPDGDITVAEAQTLTALDLSNADWDAMNALGGGIRDLGGLENFTNLTELCLDFNDIRDFSPLAGLTKLQTLTFCGVRPDDLSPLSGLTAMVTLRFNWSYAPDQGFYGWESLGFMENMKELEVFEARNAGIRDISALAGLPKLWSVFIEENLITDISPLADVRTLREFLIAGNPIEDYSCLEPVREVFPALYPDFQPDVALN
ncbi:MAG: leucine-rich repeat domain-containing protein [Oscillospiraceae bacterium]|nr:leucine-rich repeat domain-containing protein [Oscillospiraceae bacterium]